MFRSVIAMLAVSGAVLGLTGCGNPAPPTAHADEHGGEHHGHIHVAPHGGTLVVLGEEAGHFELLLDADAGTLTAYALDGEAEHPVRLTDAAIAIELIDAQGNVETTLSLSAVANPLTGETAGDTSEFRITSETLRGRTTFNGRIGAVRFRGVDFEPTPFAFPGGNES